MWRHSFAYGGSVCPLVCLTTKLNSKSFTSAQLRSNTNQYTDWTVGGTCIKSSRLVYAPHLVQSVQLHLFKCRGGDNAHRISKNKMAATAVQWELWVLISVKIWRICEFRVIMGIMTGLLGCCSSSTLGSRANDYHSPCSLGCWTNNTLAAQSLSPKQILSPIWAKNKGILFMEIQH